MENDTDGNCYDSVFGPHFYDKVGDSLAVYNERS